MAEAYLKKFGGGVFEVESGGIRSRRSSILRLIRALQEDGIDISSKETQSVFDLYKAGRTFSYVVTVCSKEAGERCPIFPGRTEEFTGLSQTLPLSRELTMRS